MTKDGKIVTRPADFGILQEITRAVVMEEIANLQLRLEERAFTVEEASNAAEAFVTAATQLVMPVVKIDGKDVGNGKPGPVATRLREQFHRFAEFSH